MSYDDELNDLDEDIRQELQRQKSVDDPQFRTFSNSTELLSFLRSAAVRRDIKTLTFSAALQRLRTRAGVSLEDLAAALELSPLTLEQLESNEELPWSQQPSAIASVAATFRFHIRAIENLTRNSLTIASVSGRIGDQQMTDKLIFEWLRDVRLALQTRGEAELLD